MARLVAYFLLLSLVTVGLVAALAYLLAREALKDSVFQRLRAATIIKADQMDQWVEAQRREIVHLADRADIQAEASLVLTLGRNSPDALVAEGALRRKMELAAVHKPDLENIFILSYKGGRVIISTDRHQEGQYRVDALYFISGRYQTFVQPVYPSPVTLNPTMTVATPLVSLRGEPLGVLAAHLDLGRMDRIIFERTGLGRTGEVYLVDKFNFFVSAERFGRSGLTRGVHSPAIDAAVRGRSGTGLYRNYEGVSVIGAYHWLERLELALVAEIHQREAFAPARRLAWTTVLVGLGSALLLACGVFFLAREIASPVKAVAQAASQVAAGDLSARAPVMTSDEVGTLAMAFNQMADRLKDLYQGLEDKVAQLKEAEGALRQSEEYYRNFFEEDLTGDFVADGRGRFTSSNPAFLKILGFDSKAEAGRTRLEELFFSREDYQGLLDLLRARRRLEYHELLLHRRDGKKVHLVANLSGEFDQQDRLTGLKGYLFDDTGRKELEEQFRQAQKMEALGRLAGGVAHDFNNLMTAVTGYSELILESLDGSHPLRGPVEQIAMAGERAASLTSQLLAFSRRQVLNPRTLDLNQVVRETKGMMDRLVGEDIVFATRLSPDLGRIQADASQIQQVLMNLVINARDSMPEGGRLTISTANLEPGQPLARRLELGAGRWVVLTVADTGLGMDKATQARIFEPFFTTKAKDKGTGLGLSTVHGVVEQSGGMIRVESRPGRGSTFRIILPRLEEEPRTEQPPPLKAGEKSGTETILLVEDEKAVRELAREILERRGHRVLAAENGVEALDRVKDGLDQIDLLLTDVIMPRLGGRDLARQLRRVKPELKVLFISGYTDRNLSPADLNPDNSAFLAKPFKPAVLFNAVRELLDKG